MFPSDWQGSIESNTKRARTCAKGKWEAIEVKPVYIFHPAQAANKGTPAGRILRTGVFTFEPSSQEGLVNHINRFLRNRVEGCHSLGVRFKRTLSNDQLRELRGDVHVGSFQGSALHGAKSGGS